MSLSRILFHLVLVILVCWMGWQDWKTREVSNWLSLPLGMLGLAGLVYRFIQGDSLVLHSLFVVIVLTIATFCNWMGGADWKVLVGLWGLWTLGGLVALIGAGLWGMVAMIRTHDKNVSFPGIAAFAVSLLLTFVVEVSIMLDIGVIFPGKIAPFFI